MIPAHLFVGAEDAPRLGFVLHGALGAGHNFRSFIKRLTDARPEYRFALVDLRNHGKSTPAPAPHDLDAAADDLFDLAEALGRDPDVVIGHSLGGKVTLAFGERFAAAAGRREPSAQARATLKQVWALDSDPGAQVPGEAHQIRQVMGALRKNPGPFAGRAEAIAGVQAAGLSSGLANWLSTNLERQGERFVWRLDLDAIDELLSDYFSRDLWGFLERVAADDPTLARPFPEVHLLVAENSDRWSGTMKERAEALPHGPSFRLHELPDAGHW
ncbi:MAG TPA: alpha/beta hydrolase, partial [Polyangiaceae bacterium]|nr:alpha/beta hydrolase [Polyangiaceae bacterium]